MKGILLNFIGQKISFYQKPSKENIIVRSYQIVEALIMLIVAKYQILKCSFENFKW